MTAPVAVVTGASSGIGRALVQHLIKLKWNVVMADVTSPSETVPGTLFVQTDVSSWDQQVHLFQKAYEWQGRLDFCALNAGIDDRDDIFTLLDEPPRRPNLATFEVNVIGAYYGISIAAHYLSKTNAEAGKLYKGGKIVLTGSGAAIWPIPVLPQYTATKHAITGLAIVATTILPQGVLDAMSPEQLTPMDTIMRGYNYLADLENAYQDDWKENDGVYVAQAPSHEYFGPNSFLSICSRPGIEWVNSKSTSEDFEPVAVNLTKSMARRLKVEGTLPTARAIEPEPDVAWKYSSEYFSNAPEAAFRIVDQAWFNARLKAHFDHARDDSAWYALRNALLAAGCRIHLSKTAGFREAKRASWALFENAMACLPNLLLYSSSMIGVQALTLMAYFSEGLSSSSLQYMLTSNAMRLACSMGMHRQSALSWNMPRREVEHRNRLFWAIYCLEKQTVSRSGRPSMIGDDEISCCLADQNDVHLFCRLLVHLSQVSSLVAKRLSNASALKQSIADLTSTISKLSAELDRFKTATSETYDFDLSQPLDTLKLPAGLDSRQALILYFYYHCIVLNVNVFLSRPWTGGRIEQHKDDSHSGQVSHATSRGAVVQACRSIILASRSVHVDASCASLVAGFGLIYASICTFTHILHASEMGTCRSELLLLDIAIGCSHNLELQTEGEWSLPFLQDLRRIAGAVVERSRGDGPRDNVTDTARPTSMAMGHGGIRSQETNDGGVLSPETLPPLDTPTPDDLEMWSTLLQLPEPGEPGELPW
ncbi:hypothetical protein M409DRAFT_25365 [Zasmidium cellare ATCC 36951]|uniref:Xylanolytic transcriptional activator regulatory domain-containing protein n=1 Tax=Zasmidium cellare ATCC 36951 TaxID=1080233 RepID=A0A6A6CBA6_ZASCE|nr:uncharacterized protein M409DRAFT_25365 [Zasmidium cellare ATCC 36951]KAF2164487.1 hypothetical protein M409DRAFT_25365 [Zasmidium cellare ATCC 36951]